MIVPEQVKCDICGREKGATNHWIVARVSESGPAGIAFLPIDDPVARQDVPRVAAEDICGQECAHKRLSQWLETLK